MTDHMCSLILSYIPPERHEPYLSEHWFSSEIARRLYYLRPYTDITGSLLVTCTGYTQKNGVVSKVNKKFISHLTREQRTLSAAATVQVSHALPAVRFSCLLKVRGAEGPRGQFPRRRRSRKRLHRVWDEFDYRVDVRRVTQGAHPHGNQIHPRLGVAYSCCDAFLETGPAAPQ